MIYESDIQDLMSEWIARSNSPKYSDEYQKAMSECAFELRCTLDALFEEEMKARQYLDEQYADEYLATIEAHEAAA